MSKIFATGYDGTVGTELQKREVRPLLVDVTDAKWVKSSINTVLPDVIIHCAALTDVQYCEEHPEEAVNVNVGGTNNIVDVFTGTLIYLSSDHVFNGKRMWGTYQEKHAPDPVNIYGMTKYGGESIAKAGRCKTIIVRTSKLFNYEMMKEDLRYFTYSPLGRIGNVGYYKEYTNLIRRSLVHVSHFVDGLMSLVEMSDKLKHGEIVHIAGKETMSYYQFWYNATKTFGLDSNLVKPRNHELDWEAPRPFRGGLDVRKASRLGIPLYTAQEGLEEIRNG